MFPARMRLLSAQHASAFGVWRCITGISAVWCVSRCSRPSSSPLVRRATLSRSPLLPQRARACIISKRNGKITLLLRAWRLQLQINDNAAIAANIALPARAFRASARIRQRCLTRRSLLRASKQANASSPREHGLPLRHRRGAPRKLRLAPYSASSARRTPFSRAGDTFISARSPGTLRWCLRGWGCCCASIFTGPSACSVGGPLSRRRCGAAAARISSRKGRSGYGRDLHAAAWLTGAHAWNAGEGAAAGRYASAAPAIASQLLFFHLWARVNAARWKTRSRRWWCAAPAFPSHRRGAFGEAASHRCLYRAGDITSAPFQLLPHFFATAAHNIRLFFFLLVRWTLRLPCAFLLAFYALPRCLRTSACCYLLRTVDRSTTMSIMRITRSRFRVGAAWARAHAVSAPAIRGEEGKGACAAAAGVKSMENVLPLVASTSARTVFAGPRMRKRRVPLREATSASPAARFRCRLSADDGMLP